ncbi:MAG: enoyl-CoA hydratase-related protein [Nitrospinales bacterium]
MKYISIEQKEHTAILTLDNPPVNALSLAVLEELAAALDGAREDNRFKTVLLRSASEKFFAAGADIKDIAEIDSSQKGREYAEQGKNVLDKIETASKPFIAVVEGACLGGGCELAMACHLRIAGAEAAFGLPEINLGIMPGFGGTQRLPKLIGYGNALEMMLTGETIGAGQAQILGLINRVAGKGMALTAALDLAMEIGTKGTLAVAAILSATQNQDDLSWKKRMERESRLFGELCETEDKQEGANAFLEKRPPRFK